MKQVSVAEAKAKLPELIKEVEDGEQITITRRGIPVVDLIRTQKTTGKKRELGFFRHKNIEIDPDWWKPMTEEEADDFIEGRY
jgi:prevent-host-death family protein